MCSTKYLFERFCISLGKGHSWFLAYRMLGTLGNCLNYLSPYINMTSSFFFLSSTVLATRDDGMFGTWSQQAFSLVEDVILTADLHMYFRQKLWTVIVS